MRTFAAILAASVLVAACTVAGSPSAAPTPTPPVTSEPGVATPVPASPAPASSFAGRLIPATITFDGRNCTYAGPTVVPTGSVIKWTLVNTPAAADGPTGQAFFIVMSAAYDTTWEDVVASTVGHTWTEGLPAFFTPPTLQSWGEDDLAAGAKPRTLMEPYPYAVFCGVYTGEIYPAVLIRVIKG